jgi:hypothetical protein
MVKKENGWSISINGWSISLNWWRTLAVLVFFAAVALLRWWDYEGPPW